MRENINELRNRDSEEIKLVDKYPSTSIPLVQYVTNVYALHDNATREMVTPSNMRELNALVAKPINV